MSRRSKSGSVLTATNAPDRTKAKRAIRMLLEAVGLDPDDPALKQTPSKTAEAFIEVLAGGYRTTARAALGKGFPVASQDPVVVTDLPAMFVCPHHLMPAHARVHVAFAPTTRVPGLARIPRLVDALAHRLVLQEDLGRWIADALREHMDVSACVVIVEAQHTCVAVEDFARRDAWFRTRAASGPDEIVASLDREIGASLARTWATSASEPPTKKRGSSSRSR